MDAPRALRIVMATARFWPEIGGVETHCLEVGRRLVRAGLVVTVATTDRSGALQRHETVEGIVVRRFPAYPASGDLYVSPRLARFVAHGGADVVHCQGYHTAVAPLAMLAARTARTPYVVTLHSGGHSSGLRSALRPIQGVLLRPLLGGADSIVAVSRWEAEHMSRQLRLPAERFSIVPSGVDLPSSPGSAGRGEPVAGLIVSPGRLERYKGHHRVLDALPLVLRRRPDAHLRILGDGPAHDELRRHADGLGLGDRVEIGPARGRGSVAEALAAASVVVSLSEYESQGLAVYEALALGRPTVVAAGTALEELARTGAARGVPPDASAAEVAEAIVASLEAPSTPSSIRLPSWDETVDQLVALYRRAARTR